MKIGGTPVASHLCICIDFAKAIVVQRWTVLLECENFINAVCILMPALNLVVNLGVNCEIFMIYYEFD